MDATKQNEREIVEIDGIEYFIDDLTLLDDDDIADLYEEVLNEIYGTVELCGYEYDSGRLLKKSDPVAFRVGISDWMDNEITEGRYIEHEGEIYEV